MLNISLFQITFAQDLSFQKHTFDKEKGNFTVHCITADNSGLLWLGTNKGVYTFDGYEYKNIFPDDTLKNECFSLSFSDNYNELWFAGKGIWNYNFSTNSLTGITDKTSPALSNILVYDYVKHNNVIWCGTWDGLNKIEDDSITCYRAVENPKYRENVFHCLHQADSGLFVGSESGSWFFSYKTNKFSIVPVCNANNANINDYLLDANGQLWASVYNYGLCIFDKKTGEFVKANDFFLNPALNLFETLSLEEDEKYIWVGAERTVSRFSKNTNNTTKVEKEAAKEAFTAIFSKKNNTWVGTWNSALWQYNPDYNLIKQIDILHKAGVTKASNIINISNVDEDIHIATSNGTVIITDENLNLISTNSFCKDLKHTPLDFYKNISPFLFYYAKHKLLIVDKRNGTTKFLEYKLDETGGLNHYKIYDIEVDAQENIWISTQKGLSVLKKDGSIQKFYHHRKDDHSLSDNNVKDLFINSQGELLALTHLGLDIYDDKNDYFVKKATGFKQGENILEHDGYWIATTEGIFKYDENFNLLKNYNTKNSGLLHNSIQTIIADENGQIWITGHTFISKLKNENFINVPFANKLNNSDIISGIAGNSKTKLYVANSNSVFELDCKKIMPSQKDKNIIITSLLINGEDKTIPNYQSIRQSKAINLNYNQRNITISYAYLNYNKLQNTTYTYKLVGIDKNWINNGKERKLVFNNLNPGKYKLQISAIEDNGIQIEQPVSILINIESPYWQKWWFRLLLIFIAIGIIIIVFRIRVAALKKYQKELEKQVKERTKTIEDQKDEIQQQAYIVMEVNKELHLQKEEVQAINEELRTQSEILASTNEDLSKSNATKDKFFAIIAHDLKNPFSAILGFSELLYNELKPLQHERHTEIAKCIVDSSKLTFNLLQNLLEWAKTQTGNLQFKPVSFNICKIASETTQLLTPLSNKKNIQLINKIPDQTTVTGDVNMITTVIRNITNNAIKFTPEGGKITINAIKNDEGLMQIKITDSGIGMDEATCQKLFRIDVHHTTVGTSGEAGTGLGLIVCKEFIDKNGGNIWVESTTGRGSTFSFTLPIAETSIEYKEKNANEKQNTKQQSASVATETIKKAPKDAPQVLIVDDNQELRKAIKMAISSHYNTIEANDGLKGLNTAIEIIPDLIISDVVMPDMDGIEMCTKLKTDERTNHIPIIMLSSKDQVADKVEGLKTGADDYLAKPFENIELLARVNTQIENRKKLRSKFEASTKKSTPISKIKSADEKFLEKIENIIKENIENSEYDIEQFSQDIGMSSSQLYRKIGAITDLKPYELIKIIRLKKAAELLQEKNLNINEVGYAVGFKSHSHFTRLFKQHFGVAPSTYQTN